MVEGLLTDDGGAGGNFFGEIFFRVTPVCCPGEGMAGVPLILDTLALGGGCLDLPEIFCFDFSSALDIFPKIIFPVFN